MKYNMDTALQELKPILDKNQLIIFIGSGISVPPPSNLPIWDDLLKGFIEFLENFQQDLKDPGEFQDLIKDAKAHKNPIRVASVLKDKFKEINDGKLINLEDLLKIWLTEKFSSAIPNENHKLIVKTNFPFILTSNYDKLLEKAAIDEKYELWKYSYTFNHASKVAASIYEKRSAIIHIHGDVINFVMDDFVFTSEDYIRIKKKYPGFTLAIQTLLLNYSTLFVGYGASDPHLEELIEELSYFFDEKSYRKHRHFIVLRKDKVDRVLEKHKHKIGTDIITLDNYDQTTELLSKLQEYSPRPY